MSSFVDAATKEGLKARALGMKPKLPNVIATARGWEQTRPSGAFEILVSFKGLDELLGDNSGDQVADAAPVEVIAEPAPVEDAAPDSGDTSTEAPKKKAGRPKKDAAVEQTPAPESTEQATEQKAE